MSGVSQTKGDQFKVALESRIKFAIQRILSTHKLEVERIKTEQRELVLDGEIGDWISKAESASNAVRMAKYANEEVRNAVARKFGGHAGYPEDWAVELLNTQIETQASRNTKEEMQKLPWYGEIAELEDLMGQVDETIMLATSSKQLVTLYQQVLDKLSIVPRGLILLALPAPSKAD